MNLASGWLAYYNLSWSGFRHIAFRIRLRLLRPRKILTSTLMSSYVLLMCPACSLTFPLMKPSKSVQMPFTTILIYNHSFQGLVFVELMKQFVCILTLLSIIAALASCCAFSNFRFDCLTSKLTT